MKPLIKPKLFGIAVSCFVMAYTTALPVSTHQQMQYANAEIETIKVAYYQLDNFQEGDSGNGIKSGYAYEIYQKVSDYTGWQYEYVYGTWGDLFEQFKKGEIDFFAGLSIEDERIPEMNWSEIAIDTETHSVFVRKDETAITSINPYTLNGKKVGVITGSNLTTNFIEYCETNTINPEYVYYTDMIKIQDDLENGIIDAFVGIENNVSMERNAKVLVKLAEEPIYIGVTKEKTGLLQRLNNALSDIINDEPDFLHTLYKKYYSKSIVNAALTEEEQAWINSHIVLRIGYEDDYLPFSKSEKNGQPYGIITDIVEEWLDILDIRGRFKISYKPYQDYDQMFEALKSDQIDVVFPIVDNMWYSEQNGIICASNLISSSIVAIYKDNFSEESLKSISYSSHSAIQEICANSYFPNATKVVFSNRDQCLDAVMDGTVGCTLFNSTRAEMAVREEKYSSLSIASLGQTVDYSFAVKKGERVLLSLLNRGISLMNTSDLTNKIFNYVDYGSTISLKEFVKDNLVWVGLFAFVVALAIAILQYLNFRKLKTAFAEVKRANEAKSAFFFNMSHDIRTPMNAIIGFTNMGMKYIDDKEKVIECLDKTQRSGTLLLSLINNVLDMSKIESNRAVLEQNSVDIMNSFENIKFTMNELAKPKNIEVTFEFGEIKNRFVYADLNKTIRVLTNLISNGIKYTPDGGKVHVYCEQSKDAVNGVAEYTYIISDNGIGMSKDFQEHMFESFARETNDATNKIEGNGLGLAVCKTYIEFMNGTIECESEKGKGTTFTVKIPLKVQENADCIDFEGNELAEGGANRHEGKERDLNGLKVLLVDDNMLNIEIAKDALEESNMIVETACDGEQAVNMVCQKGPSYYDFILMDIQMPVMNGYEATQAIRELYPDDDIVIIALSANAFQEDKEESIKAGMNDHIAKPIDKNVLFNVVAKHLK